MTGVSIEFLNNGWVLPLTYLEPPREGSAGRFDGSVHYENGGVCLLGNVQMAHSLPAASPFSFAASEKLMATPGRHIFGGLLNNVHFGHFITESLVRLWAGNVIDSSFSKSFVFYKYSVAHKVPNFVLDTVKMIFPEHDVTIVEEPTLFEELAVPQEIKTGSYIYGHPLIRKMCEPLRMHCRAHRGPKKIFVSRSRLGIGNGGIIFESVIDDYMRAEGYTVLYPETMSVPAQLEAYYSADMIVFSDGSALHLYALVARKEQKLFVVWRRGIYSIYDWQIQTFGGPRVQGESCVEELWVPEKDPSISFGKAMIDFAALSAQLFNNGFIHSSCPWNSPTSAELSQYLECLMEERRLRYVQVTIPS